MTDGKGYFGINPGAPPTHSMSSSTEMALLQERVLELDALSNRVAALESEQRHVATRRMIKEACVQRNAIRREIAENRARAQRRWFGTVIFAIVTFAAVVIVLIGVG